MLVLRTILLLLLVAVAYGQAEYEWLTDQEFGQCTATECGQSGWRFRQVTCVIVGTTVPQNESNCEGQTKPSNWHQCVAGDCVLAGITTPVTPVVAYEWVNTSSWGSCTVTCGDGIQERIIGCKANGSPISTVFCEGLDSLGPKPAETRLCNLTDCPVTESTVTYHYIFGDWEVCSAECDGGIQNRQVVCVGKGADYAYQATEEECSSIGIDMPETARTCNMQSCDPVLATTSAPPTTPLASDTLVRYIEGSFSLCSATCGYATRSRRVLCVETLDGAHTHVDDSLCPGTKPDETIVCQGLPACPDAATTTSPDVATTTEQQPLTTRGQTTMVSITTTVAPSTTLVYEQTTIYINEQATTLYIDPSIERAAYVVGRFGECDCSTRQKTRYVLCVDYRSNGVFMIPDMHCEASRLERPSEVGDCDTDECPGTVAPIIAEWDTAIIEECSRTCGGGLRTVQVFCINAATGRPVSDDLCEADQRPLETEECATNECDDDSVLRGSFWSIGDWGECDVTCGVGEQTRPINCYYFVGAPTTDISTECDIASKPSETGVCDKGRCHGFWVSSEWSECSTSCGFGIQSRIVDCRWEKTDLTTIEDIKCNGSKPITRTGCKLDECPIDYACGNMLKGSGGNISSPFYPDNYPNDVVCKNVLVAEGSTSGNGSSYIEIDFRELEIEEETDCNFDYIEVYDMKTGVTDRICAAPDMPMKWTSEGNMVEVTFVSDASINKKGYSASWTMMEQ